MSRNYICIFSLFLMLCACGIEVGNPKNPGDGTDKTESVTPTVDSTVDSNLYLAALSGQIEDGLDAGADDVEAGASSVGLALYGDALAQKRLLGYSDSKTCQKVNDDLVVVRSISGSRSFQRGVGRLARTIAETVSGSITRTWSADGSTLACNTAATRPDIDWRETDALSVNVSRDLSTDYTVTHKRSGSVLFSSSATRQGDRTVTFSREESSDPAFKVMRAQIQFAQARVTTAENLSGDSVQITSSHATDEDEPLVILTSHSASTGLWTEKVYREGTIVSTQKDGSILKSTYNNVVIGSGAACMPSSGIIEGALYDPSDEETALYTYAIDFSADEPTIVFSNGVEQEYVVGRCDLE